jgi:hypothetical protein|tara:strand:+ start:116 stop:475 length:360 start_codon:yes stop_codon:yes gene_type:complete
MSTYKIFVTEEGLEKDLTREDVVEMLRNDVATVTFTKADGTERVMECTLLNEVLTSRVPEVAKMAEKPEKRKKAPNPHTLAVYDVPADGWRSFRLDSVKSIGFPTSIFTDEGITYPTFE